jgi:aspartate aminotransferase
MAGVMCPRSSGAFYVMARLPVEDTEHFCIWMLENFEVEGHTLMLAPGAGFYSTPQMGRNEARIAYVLDLHDLSRAMELLDEALHAYPERLRESAIAQQQQEIVG